MANTLKNRMPAQNLQADIDTYLALKAIDGYKPYDNAYALDALVALQWNIHELILDVKSQVKALYGPYSDEVAALGLKKKSERKARPRANRAAAGV